jgi:hypothetical protein
MVFTLPLRTREREMQREAAAVVETSSNQFFRVTDLAGIDHAWQGIEVKKVRGEWVPKAKARPVLVRKAATRVVEG